jgi:hypothetical protein
MGQRLATCHNNEIAKFPIAPSKNPYFIDRGIARKGSNQARSVEVGRPLSAQSKPDCTEIRVAKTVDQTLLKIVRKKHFGKIPFFANVYQHG